MIELFIDYNSPPSRTVLAFCLVNGLSFKVVLTTVLGGGTRTPEFTKLNPSREVPCIRDGDFVLSECNAILQYLADMYCRDSHWYPADPAVRARVDWMLHWHHWNTRHGCSAFIYRELIKPLLSGRALPDSLRQELREAQDRALTFLNKCAEVGWLAATDHPSLADLIVVSELTHLKLLEFDYSRYPALKQWLIQMLTIPGVLAAHEVFFKETGQPTL